MPDFASLEPSIDPNNRATFLLDWEVTMKCNLDCSYCPTGVETGSHDNSTTHPPLDECLRTIDFMFKYVDLYMRYKSPAFRYVVLNVYGGESLHHPDIKPILEQVRERYLSYQDRWRLTVTTTTNAIISSTRLSQIIPLIDEFTVSYHPEMTDRQRETFRENIVALHQSDSRLKCVVMMHDVPELFDDAKHMLAWLESQGIRAMPKQIDNRGGVLQHNLKRPTDRTTAIGTYDQQQLDWFDSIYQKKSHKSVIRINTDDANLLSDQGRACCGGRQTCQDQNYGTRNYFVPDNRFEGWYCSVNWFFVYIKQINGSVYVNKDCRMDFSGDIGPIGNVNQPEPMLTYLEQHLNDRTLPVIQCRRERCLCGLCAPKAATLEIYQKIFPKYVKDYQL